MNALTRCLVPITLVATIAGSVEAQRFPMTPENSWVYETLSNFRKAGILQAPDELFRGTPSRYEVTLAVVQVYDKLQEITRNIQEDWKEMTYLPLSAFEWRDVARPIYDRAREFLKSADDIEALAKIVDVFAPELVALGRDIEEMKEEPLTLLLRVAGLTRIFWFAGDTDIPEFPDVPRHHWVYGAVYDGLQRGHLFGYPNGWFEGDRPVTRYEIVGPIDALYQDMSKWIAQVKQELDSLRNSPLDTNAWSRHHADDLVRFIRQFALGR